MGEKLTIGAQKVARAFEGLLETERFLNMVGDARKKLKIPKGGYSQEYWEWMLGWWTPPLLYNVCGSNPEREQKKRYMEAVEELQEMLPTKGAHPELLLRNYVYFGIAKIDPFSLGIDGPKAADVCIITNADEECEVFILNDDQEDYSPINPREHNRAVYDFIYPYPIAIRILPGASQNAVIDFIEKNWGQIEVAQDLLLSQDPMQKRIKNSKTRVKEANRRRDDLIYANQHLSLREISQMLADRREAGEDVSDADIGYIGKIRSVERKRRKGSE